MQDQSTASSVPPRTTRRTLDLPPCSAARSASSSGIASGTASRGNPLARPTARLWGTPWAFPSTAAPSKARRSLLRRTLPIRNRTHRCRSTAPPWARSLSERERESPAQRAVCRRTHSMRQRCCCKIFQGETSSRTARRRWARSLRLHLSIRTMGNQMTDSSVHTASSRVRRSQARSTRMVRTSDLRSAPQWASPRRTSSKLPRRLPSTCRSTPG